MPHAHHAGASAPTLTPTRSRSCQDNPLKSELQLILAHPGGGARQGCGDGSGQRDSLWLRPRLRQSVPTRLDHARLVGGMDGRGIRLMRRALTGARYWFDGGSTQVSLEHSATVIGARRCAREGFHLGTKRANFALSFNVTSGNGCDDLGDLATVEGQAGVFGVIEGALDGAIGVEDTQGRFGFGACGASALTVVRAQVSERSGRRHEGIDSTKGKELTSLTQWARVRATRVRKAETMMTMQWWRIEARVEGIREPFVDWELALTLTLAATAWEDGARTNGLPVEKSTVTIRRATDEEARRLNA